MVSANLSSCIFRLTRSFTVIYSKRVFSARSEDLLWLNLKSGTNKMRTYEDAICTLNSFISNAEALQKIRERRQLHPEEALDEAVEFLEATGLTTESLNALNVIHIAGTKGKGSTCAFIECILRHHGFKTGFFSSPHLATVRERFRINGKSISKERFSSKFWDLYEKLVNEHGMSRSNLPSYFKFLTIMAFHIFLEEKVDVAVMEVGIGGAYDTTNIVPKPVVCGITTLDLDHCSILGDTIEQIAWQKSGIFKPGSIGVAVPQEGKSLAVFCERAVERKTLLYLVPPLQNYVRYELLKPGIPGNAQLSNITLALQVANIWMMRRSDPLALPETYGVIDINGFTNPVENFQIPVLTAFPITKIFRQAIAVCSWPGRSQIVRRQSVTYFIDGAHTPKSMEKSHFDHAIFSTNEVRTERDAKSELGNMSVPKSLQLERCHQNEAAWLKLLSKQKAIESAISSSTVEVGGVLIGDDLKCAEVVECASDAMAAIERLSNKKHCFVLVTGSLHLVGSMLTLLDPQLVPD